MLASKARGVVAGGNEQGARGIYTHTTKRDQGRCSRIDQRLELAVKMVHFLSQVPPSKSESMENQSCGTLEVDRIDFSQP